VSILSGEDQSTEIRQELKIVPAQASVVKHVRYTYACRRCDREAVTGLVFDMANYSFVTLFLSYQTIRNYSTDPCSMNRKGNCWDNAVRESFFRTLKVEFVCHCTFENPFPGTA